MDLERIRHLLEKPSPFTPGEPLFWDDPYISAQMLATHLDSTVDLASRRPETIDRSVAWMVEKLNLQQGMEVLDLGCGPGLYASRLAQRGIHMTGVDFSRRSIKYAKQQAQELGLEIRYRYQNYLTLEDTDQFDAAMLIFGDYCTFSPADRALLLRNVFRALKPGGTLILDVSTREHRKRHGSTNGWYVAEKGFWRPGLHLVLEQGFDYPEQSIFLDQVIVIEEDNRVTVYRMWFQDYTPEVITHELEQGGFTIESAWNDLIGTPYSEDTEWIGVIVRKKNNSSFGRRPL